MALQPYVLTRLLNQRARMKAPSPEFPSPPPEIPDWEPDSDAYDTDLEEDTVTQSSKAEFQGIQCFVLIHVDLEKLN